MNMIEQIKADRKIGTEGPWDVTDGMQSRPIEVAGCVIAHFSNYSDAPPHRRVNTLRIARVPDMEAALIAANDLADAVDFMNESGCQTAVSQLMMCLDKFRSVVG